VPYRLKALPIRPIATALAIGAVGGAVAHWIGLPLAWMLGSMLATLVASLAGVRASVPMGLRQPVLMILGVFIGGSFSPDSVSRIADWPWTLTAVAALVPVSTWLAARYYAQVAGFDGVTALFSATPGGLSSMVMIGGASGGDERLIALTQGLRVFIIVLLIPLAVDTVMPLSEARAQLDATAPVSADLGEWLILVLGVGVGVVAAHLIRLPAPLMTGAMVASAALHLTGASTVMLPDLLLQLALWIVGSSIGAQFAGFRLRTLFAVGRHAAIVAVMMIALAAAVAVGLGAILDLDILATVLAFVPGGVAEMCLIAVVLDADPTFVAVHHLLRLLLILLLAPVVGAMAKRRALAKLALPDR